MIREVQGVGSIIVLILFLRQYSVQHISLKIMDGMDLFLQNMGRDLKRGVGEDEAGGSGTVTRIKMVLATVMTWTTNCMTSDGVGRRRNRNIVLTTVSLYQIFVKICVNPINPRLNITVRVLFDYI